MYYAAFLHVYSFQDGHGVTHKVEVLCSNCTCDLKVANLVRILFSSLDKMAQGSGFSYVHNIVLAGLTAMGVKILCPVNNLTAGKLKSIFASQGLLVYVDVYNHLLAGLIGNIGTLLEVIGNTINCYCK